MNIMNEIKELQSLTDRFMMMIFELGARNEALNQMVFGVLRSTLTQEEYKTVYTKFVDTLEGETNKALSGLDDLVYDSESLLKFRFELQSTMNRMKCDPDYTSSDSSKPQS